jgi:predicted acetyltransferase
MEIRKALSQDTKEVKELWKYCFNDSDVFVDWYFTHKYRDENTIIAVEDKTVSALQIIPYTLNIRQSNQESGYVVGVSTAPEARGKGIIPKLIKFSFEDMRKRGINISILMPFMFSFYTRYGYDLCYHQIKHKFQISKLKDIILTGGKFVRARQDSISALKVCYGLYMTNKHGYVMRNEKEWLDIMGDLDTDGGQIYIYIDENNRPKGYISYYIEDETMIVKEMAYDNIVSQRHLYSFIYNHISHLKHVTLRLAIDDLTHFLVPDLNQEMSILPFMMTRIIDVKKLLTSIRYPENIKESLSFRISDPLCPWNEAPFRLEIYNGLGVCHHLDKNCNIDITCSINTLGQIVMGEIDILDLERLEKISLYEKNILTKLTRVFPRQNNYINEYI